MSYAATTAPVRAPDEQKTLNEELIEVLVEVAQRNAQHAVELFGIPLGVAVRLAGMSDAHLHDLATTPVALWRPALGVAVVRGMPERRMMRMASLEVYRPLLERLNRLVLITFLRYADDPRHAALSCGLPDLATIRALRELPAYACLEWAGNPGVSLVLPRISEPLIDRLVRPDDVRVDSRLRSLLAINQCGEQEYLRLRAVLATEAGRHGELAPVALNKRSGRPVSNFLMPETAELIVLMLRHSLRPTEIEERLFATNDVRAAQLRNLSTLLNPKPKRIKGAPRDRSRDHRDLWGSALRRLTASAIFRLQRRLIDAGVEPFEAMVRAYDYYARTHDVDCGVPLTRMLKDVFHPLRHGGEVDLSYCLRCRVAHLSHQEKSGIIECPVCVLARSGKYGARRLRVDRLDSAVLNGFESWIRPSQRRAANAARHHEAA